MTEAQLIRARLAELQRMLAALQASARALEKAMAHREAKGALQ